ncbi:hypothetical protein QUB05_23695 [Microcoleus sp. F10-C6]|uniref:hypothetical protein n=2 Tax=unclassified Microcoleus TaxID=2642155 RepID=UPI002FD68113
MHQSQQQAFGPVRQKMNFIVGWAGDPALERLIDNDARCHFQPIVSGEGKNVILMQVPRIRCCGQTPPPPANSMEVYRPALGQNGMSPEGIFR